MSMQSMTSMKKLNNNNSKIQFNHTHMAYCIFWN